MDQRKINALGRMSAGKEEKWRDSVFDGTL